jgi:hypothetical protein
MTLWGTGLDMLLVFDSTHQALTAEAALEDAGLEVVVVPVPHRLVKGCGLAVAFAKGDRAHVLAALTAAKAGFLSLYRFDSDDRFTRVGG